METELRAKEEIIPFEWSGWDEVNILVNIYYDVEFTENFGSFKKDEKFRSISVDCQKGLIEAYSEDGSEVIRSQKFKCTPIE